MVSELVDFLKSLTTEELIEHAEKKMIEHDVFIQEMKKKYWSPDSEEERLKALSEAALCGTALVHTEVKDGKLEVKHIPLNVWLKQEVEYDSK